MKLTTKHESITISWNPIHYTASIQSVSEWCNTSSFHDLLNDFLGDMIFGQCLYYVFFLCIWYGLHGIWHSYNMVWGLIWRMEWLAFPIWRERSKSLCRYIMTAVLVVRLQHLNVGDCWLIRIHFLLKRVNSKHISVFIRLSYYGISSVTRFRNHLSGNLARGIDVVHIRCLVCIQYAFFCVSIKENYNDKMKRNETKGKSMKIRYQFSNYNSWRTFISGDGIFFISNLFGSVGSVI